VQYYICHKVVSVLQEWFQQHYDKYDRTQNTGTITVEQKQHYDKYDTAQNTGTIPVEQKQPYYKYDIAHNTGTIPVSCLS
jgi:hypothetical protein